MARSDMRAAALLLVTLFILFLPHASGGRPAAQPPVSPAISIELRLRLRA